jgi:uncharacterized membrane protein YfcA
MLSAFPLGLFCLSVGAALGMASGIFIVPILTMVVGVDIHVAIGASIVSVIACSCGSAAPFLRERLTNVRFAIVLEALGASPPLESAHFVSAGIVLLIALPALHVAMMGVWFLFSRDLDFAFVAAFVLAIIVASALIGAAAVSAAGFTARF